MVFLGVRIDDVGLTEKRTTMSWPVEMPPRMPPAWFEENTGPSVTHGDFVGIRLTREARCCHAFADFDALDGVDRHHGGGKIGIEFAIDRGAETRRVHCGW